MSAHPSTPLQQSPFQDNSRKPFEELEVRSSFKSPQVNFDAMRHARTSPKPGRRSWKRKKEILDKRKAAFSHKVVSPSVVFSRSMLSFDLEARRDNEEDVVGENELFVKFCSNRRQSTGRGTLQTLINKKIALQATGRVLVQRQAQDTADVPKPTESPVLTKPAKQKTKKSLKIDPVRCRQYELEIPLAQEARDSLSSLPSEHQDGLSQTQVYAPQDSVQAELSQTQIYVPAGTIQPGIPHTQVYVSMDSIRAISQTSVCSPSPVDDACTSKIPFMSTPLPSIPEGRSWARFLDLEASQSEDGEHGCSDEDEEASDISGLLASDDEDLNEDGSAHALLHRQWEEEAEQQRIESQEPNHVPRRLRMANVSLEQLSRVVTKAKIPNKPPIKSVKPAPSKPVVAKSFPQREYVPRAKKYPNRRSSVSSCGAVEIIPPQKDNGGTFSFLSGGSIACNVVEPKPTGQRLMGAKRFAFGDLPRQT